MLIAVKVVSDRGDNFHVIGGVQTSSLLVISVIGVVVFTMS